MENTPRNLALDHSDEPNYEPIIATPLFDEKSIQQARPAVPLTHNTSRHSWPLAFVLMCVAASLTAGVIGGILLARHQRVAVNEDEPARSTAAKTLPANQSEAVPPPAVTAPSVKDVAAPKKDLSTIRATPVEDSTEHAATEPEEDDDTRAVLNDALDEWIAATNAGDIRSQMNFYGQTVNAFYLSRNVPREAVRNEKSRVFGHADVIDIRAASPDIRVNPDGRTATMRFRKKYAIEGGGEDRRGEVLQELRWRRTDDGWKIVSERDLRVIR